MEGNIPSPRGPMDQKNIPKLDTLLLRVSRFRVFRKFLLYFLPLACLFTGLYYLAYYYNFHQKQSLEQAAEFRHTQLARAVLIRDLELIASDLLLLARSPEMRTLVNSGKNGLLPAVQNRFLDLARDRHIYDQIRYLDQTGQEVIRINFDGEVSEVIDEDQLQFKGDRYYFQETSRLGENEIFVSPLDLNVERGKVEIPHKPVLRVALPMANTFKEPRGVLILNYLARPMLQRMRASLPTQSSTIYGLINSTGCWLDHPDTEKTFRFMFDKAGCFAEEHQDAWEIIRGSSVGQLNGQRGHYTFARISPVGAMTLDLTKVARSTERGGHWWIIAYRPLKPFPVFSGEETDLMVLFTFLILLALAGVGSWQIARSRCSREQWESFSSLLFHAVDQSPAGIMITNTDGDIEYINAKFTDLSGYTEEQALGQNPRFLKSDEKSSEEYADLWATITRGETWTGEFHNIKSNGDDYYAKTSISPVLDSRGEIAHFIGVQEDVTSQRRLQQELLQLATTDPLTGLHNRRFLFDCAEKEIDRCCRYHHPLSVMLMDLDHFKKINDSFGHDAGDQVLRAVARMLEGNIRSTDLVVRYGGEEFVVMLPETDLTKTLAFAERLRAAVEAMEVEGIDDGWPITLSIGCSPWHPHEKSIEDALTRADQAMYQCKSQGRNRVSGFR